MDKEKKFTIFNLINPIKIDKESRRVEKATKRAEKVLKKAINQPKKKYN